MPRHGSFNPLPVANPLIFFKETFVWCIYIISTNCGRKVPSKRSSSHDTGKSELCISSSGVTILAMGRYTLIDKSKDPDDI
jgi:hypothetical protein